MTNFGEWFLRYREKVWDMLEQEVGDDNRAYCQIPYPQDALCVLCERHSFDHGLSWDELCRTCDSEQCRELWAWYLMRGRDGSKRRLAFKEHFGKRIWEIDRSLRRESILTAMLTIESREVNAGSKRQRVVA